MENQPTADPSAIRFTKQERKLLMQAMAIIEHYGQLDRPELKAKIDALTEPKKGSWSWQLDRVLIQEGSLRHPGGSVFNDRVLLGVIYPINT